MLVAARSSHDRAPCRRAASRSEVILARDGGARCALENKELALDAKLLRQAPVFFLFLGSSEHFFYGHQPLRRLACPFGVSDSGSRDER
jgi:hypothetical protein